MSRFTESAVEEAPLGWLESVGWTVVHGGEIAPVGPRAERAGYGDVVLEERLRAALARLNPGVPAEGIEDAYRRLTRAEAPTLEAQNRAIHWLLVDGVTVEYHEDGRVADPHDHRLSGHLAPGVVRADRAEGRSPDAQGEDGGPRRSPLRTPRPRPPDPRALRVSNQRRPTGAAGSPRSAFPEPRGRIRGTIRVPWPRSSSVRCMPTRQAAARWSATKRRCSARAWELT